MKKILLSILIAGSITACNNNTSANMSASASVAVGSTLSSTIGESKWEYSTDIDPMSDSTVNYATLRSSNSLNLGEPYSGENYGDLYIRKSKNSKVEVVFTIDKGQLMCDRYKCTTLVRFDNKQPITFSMDLPDDNSANVLFFTDSAKFVENAKTAKQILIEVTMFKEGSQHLLFKTPAELTWEK